MASLSLTSSGAFTDHWLRTTAPDGLCSVRSTTWASSVNGLYTRNVMNMKFRIRYIGFGYGYGFKNMIFFQLFFSCRYLRLRKLNFEDVCAVCWLARAKIKTCHHTLSYLDSYPYTKLFETFSYKNWLRSSITFLVQTQTLLSLIYSLRYYIPKIEKIRIKIELLQSFIYVWASWPIKNLHKFPLYTIRPTNVTKWHTILKDYVKFSTVWEFGQKYNRVSERAWTQCLSWHST